MAEPYKQNELATMMTITIQFGLKYFSIYGIRLDKDKKRGREVNALKYLFSSQYHYKIEIRNELFPHLSTYITSI